MLFFAVLGLAGASADIPVPDREQVANCFIKHLKTHKMLNQNFTGYEHAKDFDCDLMIEGFPRIFYEQLDEEMSEKTSSANTASCVVWKLKSQNHAEVHMKVSVLRELKLNYEELQS